MRRLVLVLIALAAVAATSLVWAGSTSAATPSGAGTDPGNPGQSADMVIGPYTIQPQSGGGDTDGLSFSELLNMKWQTNVAPPCQDCDITSITPDLTDTNGNSVNLDSGLMLHHVVFYQQGATDVSCPGFPSPAFLGKRIFASGNERTSVPYVPGYGMYIAPGSLFAGMGDVMNYSTQPQTVELRLHVTYVPGNTLKSVTPVWLDETSCNVFPPSYYSIPAGQSHQTSTWTSTLNGKIIGIGGHVHPYGLHITASDATTNTPLCDSVATQMNMGSMPMISNMTKCIGSAANDYSIADIHQGDQIKLDTYYNAPKAESLAVMGIALMYVYQG